MEKVIKLSKEYTWEGKTYNEFKMDFDKLTGQDMLNIEKEMSEKGEFSLSPEVSPSYCVRIAARAAGVAFDVLANLPMQDFNRIRNIARNFMMGLR